MAANPHPSGITTDTLVNGLLAPLIGPSGRFPGAVDTTTLDDAITQAEGLVQSELSTRFVVTEMRGWMGAGAAPDNPTSDPPLEYEPAFDWGGANPGDMFARFVTRVRPLQALLGCTITLPGGVQAPIQLPLEWFRLDHTKGELMVAPSLLSAPLTFSGLSGPIVGIVGKQIPKSVLLDYTAGLTPADLKKWPKIARLVLLEAAIEMLPQIAMFMNPDMVTSVSGDGLSQSRSSGYIFKDMETRLRAEADGIKEFMLNLWDGPQFTVL